MNSGRTVILSEFYEKKYLINTEEKNFKRYESDINMTRKNLRIMKRNLKRNFHQKRCCFK